MFTAGLALGYDYQMDSAAVNLVNNVTGMNFAVTTSPVIESSLQSGEQSYRDYYWVHLMASQSTNSYYNVGQVLSTHIDAIVKAGYRTVINFRANGEGTNLLPGETYGTGQGVNNDEFSDANGYYNLTAEMEQFASHGILPSDASTAAAHGGGYFSLPVSGWTVALFESYYPTIHAAVTAAAGSPILTHCASGYRSTGFMLAYEAVENKYCTDWVLTEARKVGLSFDQSSSDAAVINFLHELLSC